MLLTDLADLAGLSVGGPLYLVRTSLGEGNAEHPQSVVVRGLDINMGLNQSLPLADQRPQLVCCEVHTLQFQTEITISIVEFTHVEHQTETRLLLIKGEIPRSW